MTVSWYANDALWSALEHGFDGPEAWARAPAEAEAITTLCDLAPGSRVADLAAGTGRIALELARAGHTVSAVERHPAFAQRIARRGKRESIEIEIVRRDMLGFERAEAFDALVLWGDSFGYFESSAEDRAFLSRCAKSVRTDGKLIVQVTPKEAAAEGWPRRTWMPLSGDRLLLEESLIVRSYSAVRHTWILVDGAERTSFHGTRRLYSAAELEALLYENGFGDVECFGGLDGRPFTRGSTELVAVATR